MKTVLYARYSTENQSIASIEDQFRVCRARAVQEGWKVVNEYGDDATSGSTALIDRRAGRALAADITKKGFDILLVESLDRLSRDQIEQEIWVRRMEHFGMRIVGISDGYDSQQAGRKIMRGVRGLINELYIDDLRSKTHRGQTGKVLTGYVAGGKSFGYKIIRHGDPENPTGSTYEVEPGQAEWVRYIFERYARGESCQKIVHALNAHGVPSPRGSTVVHLGPIWQPAEGQRNPEQRVVRRAIHLESLEVGSGPRHQASPTRRSPGGRMAPP